MSLEAQQKVVVRDLMGGRKQTGSENQNVRRTWPAIPGFEGTTGQGMQAASSNREGPLGRQPGKKLGSSSCHHVGTEFC